MARTDSGERNWWPLAGGGFLAVVALWLLFRLLFAPAQMGTDEEVFNTVDALFTAVTTRDQQRLTDCDERLQSYRQDGKLPETAAKQLEAIIQKANAGQWETSARTLYDFMLAQRRGA